MKTTIALLVVLSVTTGALGQISSEGTRFAFAAPHSSYTAEYETELIITAKQTASVTVSYQSTSDDFTVATNGSYSYGVPHAIRVNTGIEDKAVYVTSDVPVAVHIASGLLAGPRIPDATLVRAVSEDCLEFALASFVGHVECDRVPRSFYSVVATEDDTDVQVWRRVSGTFELDEEFSLSRSEVFTKDAYTQPGQNHLLDYTGAYVSATKPVAVYSGQGCAVVPNQEEWINQYYHESIPSFKHLGSNYATIPYVFGSDSAGYYVRVISTHDDTVVTCTEMQIFEGVLAGEFLELEFPHAHGSTKVSCSHPCLVTQYAKEDRNTNNDYNKPQSGFMAVVTPEGGFSDDVTFHTPAITTSSATTIVLAIVVLSGPVSDLYLNGDSLSDLNWQDVTGEEQDHVFASTEITPGMYRLYSFSFNNRFAAYVHTVDTTSNAASIGYPLGYGVRTWTTTTTSTVAPTTPPATTTTTAPPGEGEECVPPYYRVSLLGNFTSGTGDDYTPECSNDYNDNLREKATFKIPELDAMLGTTLCTRFAEDDFSLVTVGTAFKAEGTYGGTEIDYIMHPKNHLRIEEVYECGDELNLYLQNFTNWGYPVIPPVQDCPQPVFDPHYFFDGSTKMDWVCLDTNDVQQIQGEIDNSLGYVAPASEVIDRDPPSYALNIWDNFTTMFADELDIDCTRAYTNDWESKVLGMLLTVKSKVDSGELCPSEQGLLTILTSTSSFTSQGPEGSIVATYYFGIIDDSARFIDVCNCASEVFDYLEIHTNWGTLPILPQPADCTPLIFNPAIFYHHGEKWGCVSSETAVQSEETAPSGVWQWLKALF